MTNAEVLGLQSLGRIVIQIKGYRQSMPIDRTDKGLNSYLKSHLSINDFNFWQFMQTQPLSLN
jgi:hypothetical protein